MQGRATGAKIIMVLQDRGHEASFYLCIYGPQSQEEGKEGEEQEDHFQPFQ